MRREAASRHLHRAQQLRSLIPGIEAISLVSQRGFPRHAHDHFGIGVIAFGGHRSWSGVGTVEAAPGDVIMVNPGELHDGLPIRGAARGWRMLQFDPGLIARELAAEHRDGLEIVRPAVRDPWLAARIVRLFAGVTARQPDPLAVEQDIVLTLMHVLRRHGMRPPQGEQLSPPVVRALQRLDAAPADPVSLTELSALAGMSRFQLLRGFAREVGVTPHAYLIQQRVRLARRYLASGLSPAAAASVAGFADQSHMTRAFVRHLGVTPARYRAALT